MLITPNFPYESGLTGHILGPGNSLFCYKLVFITGAIGRVTVCNIGILEVDGIQALERLFADCTDGT
jgi:hypothetical protein